MKSKLATILILVFVAAPASSAAIVIETRSEATSRTGGVRAENGESVTTGPNRSSVQITNVLYGNSSGSTSTVEVRRSTNGVVESRREVHTAPDAAGVRIEASASGGSVMPADSGINIKTTVTPAPKPEKKSPTVRTIRTTEQANQVIIPQIPNVGAQGAVAYDALVLDTPIQQGTWLSMFPPIIQSFFTRLLGSFSLFL